MRTEKFDAYGEVLPATERGKREAAAAAPILSRVGLGVFWLLVVLIISARIIFYPASPTFSAGSTGEPGAGFSHAVTR
jgi:hypothetical protein